jgi:predicted phage terminase large subunit-like protein
MDIVDTWPVGGPLVRAWDFAATKEGTNSDPDYSAGVKATMANGIMYILDVQRHRMTPLERDRMVRGTANRDTEETVILIPEDPGSAGKDVADRYRREVLLGFACYAQRVTGSKVQRADPFIAACEAGNVKLVRNEGWNQAFIDEGASFPYGAHDDQIDAAADAYMWLAKNQVVDAPMAAGSEYESLSLDIGQDEPMDWH